MAVGSTGADPGTGVVLTTHNGGKSWAPSVAPAGAIAVTSVKCTTAADCTVVASDGTADWSAATSNFGQTWLRQGTLPAGMGGGLTLSCAPAGTCLVAGFTPTTAGHGQGALALSTNGGMTWVAGHGAPRGGPAAQRRLHQLDQLPGRRHDVDHGERRGAGQGTPPGQLRRRHDVERLARRPVGGRRVRRGLPHRDVLRHGGDELGRDAGHRHRRGGGEQGRRCHLHRVHHRVHAAHPDRRGVPDRRGLRGGRRRHGGPHHPAPAAPTTQRQVASRAPALGTRRSAPAARSRQWRRAASSKPGILAAPGSASKATNRRMTSYWPGAVANQGGFGRDRNGPRTTDFWGRSNIRALPTTPEPD